MKKTLILISFLIIYNFSSSKDLNALNGYKYIIMPPLTETAGDILTKNYSLIQKKFMHKGFKVEQLSYRLWNKELREQPSIGLYSFLSFLTEGNDDKFELNLELVDIRRNPIYENKATVQWNRTIFDFSSDSKVQKKLAIKKVIDSVFYEIDNFNYQFDPEQTRSITYSEVKQTDFTYKSLRNYFKTNKAELHEIEGFYVASEYVPILGRSIVLYKVAVVRDDYEKKYNMIVISSLDKIWKEGEVKAEFSYENEKDLIYNTSFYLHDKHKKDLVSEFDPEISNLIIGNQMRVFRKIYSY
jgi:hypothetical protein